MILVKKAKLKNKDNKVELLRGDNLLVIKNVNVKEVVITIICVIKKTI